MVVSCCPAGDNTLPLELTFKLAGSDAPTNPVKNTCNGVNTSMNGPIPTYIPANFPASLPANAKKSTFACSSCSGLAPSRSSSTGRSAFRTESSEAALGRSRSSESRARVVATGKEPGMGVCLTDVGQRMRSVLQRKLMASGTSRLEKDSNW